MIVPVNEQNLDAAAAVHSAAWQESHRAFCTSEFIARHTPAHQRAFLAQKLAQGARVYLLAEDVAIGVVSVTGSLIEDLYVLPEYQNRGYGTRLLQFAMARCSGTPTLWILENNAGAERLYRRMGFRPTGRVSRISGTLREIEFFLPDQKKR